MQPLSEYSSIPIVRNSKEDILGGKHEKELFKNLGIHYDIGTCY